MCQSERPLPSSASSVHLALSRLCIPCPQDAHSVHPQPKSLGWSGSTPRLFITTRCLHLSTPPKQGTGFCSSFPAGTSGRSPKHFRKAQVGQPNLSKLWMQAAERRGVPVVQGSNAAAKIPQPTTAHISSPPRQNHQSQMIESQLSSSRQLQPINTKSSPMMDGTVEVVVGGGLN